MAILETFTKQPNDVQDYDVDWTDFIVGMGESVTDAHAVHVTVPAGITLGVTAISNGVAKAWISGGTDGQTYEVTYRLTTAGGRVNEQEIRIKVKEY